MGGSSNSRDSSEVGISTREVIAVLGGTMIGVSVLLLGVSGIIMSLPEPKYSSSPQITKMLSPDEASRAAGARLKAAKLEQAKALENPPGKHYSPSSRRMENIRIASSDEAAKAARTTRTTSIRSRTRSPSRSRTTLSFRRSLLANPACLRIRPYSRTRRTSRPAPAAWPRSRRIPQEAFRTSSSTSSCRLARPGLDEQRWQVCVRCRRRQHTEQNRHHE